MPEELLEYIKEHYPQYLVGDTGVSVPVHELMRITQEMIDKNQGSKELE